MPVTEQTPVNSSTGNGVTTVFPYSFKILAQADIEVLVDDVEQTLTTDYSVSGAGNDAGGNVTFVTAPASGASVVMRRAMSYARATDYQENGDLQAATLDDDLDAVILMMQQLSAEFLRALKLPRGTTTNQELSGTAAARANKYLAFDSDGNLTVVSTVEPGALVVSAFMEALLDDLDATAMFATIGDIPLAAGKGIVFEGTTDDAYETTLRAGDPTADRAIALPNKSGTVALTSDVSNVAYLSNLAIAASRSSNAETIALKTAAGADPSAGDPIKLAFRNATAGTGDYTEITITAATSITIPSTATMGASNGTPFRLWLVGINDGGTFRLGVINTRTASGIVALNDAMLMSATSIDASADAAGTLYAGAAVTSKAIRLLGYLDYTLTTAGTWSAAPSMVQLFGPGVKRPGEVIQTRYMHKTDTFSTASTSMTDITGLSVSLTPTSVCNAVRFESALCGGGSASNYQNYNAVRDSTVIMQADAAGSRITSTMSVCANGAGFTHSAAINVIDWPASVSALTYKMQMSVISGTGYINRTGTDTDSVNFPRGASSLIVSEIQA